ncbi:MAG TPA: ATP-dependent helicase, partial [Candidatus Binataceae bacterium]
RTRAGLASKERRFPKKGAISEVISMARNKARTLEVAIEKDFPHFIDHRVEILKLAADYEAFKRARGLVDYDDLLELMVSLLRDHPSIRESLAAQYRYILVDEYQDTNLVQAELVKLLGSKHRNVMAVGDDAQSIYSFRGAHFRNIIDFPGLFADTRVIKLEENYRSLQGILDVANDVIARADEKYTKVLFSRREGAVRPMLVRAQDERMQSRFVAQRILELREEGVALAEIAVLFRSSFHSFDLELELQRRDIPFIKRGGFKFIETAHIKDVLAHLRVVQNATDSVSWLRVLMLLRGIGHRRAQQILETIPHAANPAAVLAQLSGRAAPSAERVARLSALFAELERESIRPAEQIAGVLEYYLPVMREAYPDDYPKRERDLEHLHNITSRYRSLDAMLADMALEPPSDSIGEVLAADSEDEYLTLSTIHSAKGLEWKVVFIVWAAEGRFPSPQSTEASDLEEERRLMYVAGTRARDELYFSYPIQMFDRNLGYVLGRPSRFLEDLPAELLPTAVLEEEDSSF